MRQTRYFVINEGPPVSIARVVEDGDGLSPAIYQRRTGKWFRVPSLVRLIAPVGGYEDDREISEAEARKTAGDHLLDPETPGDPT